MAETFKNKCEGKLTFHLQERGGIQTTERTLTFPLDTQTIAAEDWAALKHNFDGWKNLFSVGSLSGVIQPTGWRDNDDSSPSTIPNTPFDVIGMEITAEHKETFGYGDTDE